MREVCAKMVPKNPHSGTKRQQEKHFLQHHGTNPRAAGCHNVKKRDFSTQYRNRVNRCTARLPLHRTRKKQE
jgi:hypothetical protein